MSNTIYEEFPFLITRFAGPNKSICYQFNFEEKYIVFRGKEQLQEHLEKMLLALKND